MAWTNLIFSFGATLTSSQMTQLDDNLDALAAGSAGAPGIQNAALATDSVRAAQIQAGAVGNSELATDSVNTSEIVNSAVTAVKIANASIITAKIADPAITTVKIVNDAVSTAKIAVNAVTASELANSAVDQGALKTTTGAVSNFGTPGVNLTLPGGSYGFYPRTKNSSSGSGTEPIIYIASGDGSDPSTSYIANIFLDNETNTETTSAEQRYIQASPPYNLGDGDIPLFMFLVIDNITGDIVSTYIAEDPPWANNGPTNIRPDRVAKDGKKYQNQILLPDGSRVSQGSPGFNALIKSKLGVQAIRDQWIDALRNPTISEVEITQDIKQADMGIIPHPFGSPQPGKTIVLLDPVGSVVDDLYLLKEQGADITDIVMNHITLGNTSNGANSPPGVMSVPAAWKNTS